MSPFAELPGRGKECKLALTALRQVSHLVEGNMVSTLVSGKVLGVGFRTAISLSFVFFASSSVAQPSANSTTPPPSADSPVQAKSEKGDQAPAPTKEQCVESHRQAQQAQNEEKLVHARELARTCTALSCPGLIVSDCARWLNDIEQRIPSVVFEVRLDGKPNLSAVVTADGKRVEEWTRGESLRVDPGEHQFRFELGDLPPVVQNLLLAEGMRYRIVSAEFTSETRPAATPATPTTEFPATSSASPSRSSSGRVPVLVYPLLGLGVVGAGGFAVFGMLGKSKQSDLENTCKPNCTDSNLRPMKTSYLIGDISLGVGVASLITAGILYVAHPEKPPTASVGFTPLPGGGAASAWYRF
jgi:hypothetical protein